MRHDVVSPIASEPVKIGIRGPPQKRTIDQITMNPSRGDDDDDDAASEQRPFDERSDHMGYRISAPMPELSNALPSDESSVESDLDQPLGHRETTSPLDTVETDPERVAYVVQNDHQTKPPLETVETDPPSSTSTMDNDTIPPIPPGREDVDKVVDDYLGVWESSLEDRANCLSNWTMMYLTPLLRKGASRVLVDQDIGLPSKQDLAQQAYQVTSEQWQMQVEKAAVANAKIKADFEEKKRKHAAVGSLVTPNAKSKREKKLEEPKYVQPSIATALMNGFGRWTIAYAIMLYVISALLSFVPVIILNDLVKFFESGQSVNEYDGLAHPWAQVAALGIAPALIALIQNRHSAIFAHCQVYVRTAVSTMLYRKTLRVSGAGRAATSTGQVVNMMSNDTAQLQRFLQFVGMIITAPIQIILALVLIYRQVSCYQAQAIVSIWKRFVKFLVCFHTLRLLIS
jgi:ABC transporter transmembrane region